jgi:hypothetical protein
MFSLLVSDVRACDPGSSACHPFPLHTPGGTRLSLQDVLPARVFAGVPPTLYSLPERNSPDPFDGLAGTGAQRTNRTEPASPGSRLAKAQRNAVQAWSWATRAGSSLTGRRGSGAAGTTQGRPGAESGCPQDLRWARKMLGRYLGEAEEARAGGVPTGIPQLAAAGSRPPYPGAETGRRGTLASHGFESST